MNERVEHLLSLGGLQIPQSEDDARAHDGGGEDEHRPAQPVGREDDAEGEGPHPHPVEEHLAARRGVENCERRPQVHRQRDEADPLLPCQGAADEKQHDARQERQHDGDGKEGAHPLSLLISSRSSVLNFR